MDRLDEIVKLVGNTAGKKEGRLVVQKYIGILHQFFYYTSRTGTHTETYFGRH